MKNKSRDVLRLRRFWIIGLVVAVIVAIIIWQASASYTPSVTLPMVASDIMNNRVQAVEVQGDTLVVHRTDNTTVVSHKESDISVFETLKLLGVPADRILRLDISVITPSGGPSALLGTLLTLTLIGTVAWIGISMMRQTRGNSMLNFNRSKARVSSQDGERPLVRFADVAGCDGAKLELAEVVDFLKEPQKFAQLGARIPKGVIMVGPPGTGKTLLAKAVAGEAGVPFFSISGSEFVEMFVGVGASRVRDLFNKAKEHAPAIIFIDEIDAVGRQRGVGIGGGHEEREQTLNQILVEMDGFGTGTNVIVVAATNRPDILDIALMRPGRFDRKVVLDRPDVNGRIAIFQVHTRGKPLASDVTLESLAKLTPGFAGADIENMVNEAAILAARRGLKYIGRAEFADALERIIAGPERSKTLLSAHERKVVAYHEAGHAVAMHSLPYADPVHKISIMSRGMALGFTMPLPEGEKVLRTREAFEDDIAGLLAGRAAEEIIFKQVTTGAANDLERATAIAQQMVTRFGMSQRLGLRAFGQQQSSQYLGLTATERDYSEEIARTIDEEVRAIIDNGYSRARQILLDRYDRLEAVACALLERETLEREDFEGIMGTSAPVA